MVVACASAVVAFRRERACVACVAVGFFCGGAALSSSAWNAARASPLRKAFDIAADVERARAADERRLTPLDPSAFAVVDGILRSDASLSPSGVSLSVDVTRLAPLALPGIAYDVSGGVLVGVGGSLVADRVDNWRAGRRVRMPVELHRPSRYLDDGVPDAERASLLRGTVLVGSAKSGALVDIIDHGSWIDERFADVRAFSRRAIRDSVGGWSARAAAVVTAIVIGDRAGLDQPVQQALQQAGTYHVLAISGGNIAILAGLMLGAFRLAGVLGRTASLAAIAALGAYGVLVGGGASVDRATLMAIVYFAARVADQRSPPLNTLALAAAVLVAVQPFSAADPAFVLTFGATLAILVVVPSVRDILPSRFKSIAMLFVASVATEAMLFPAGALFFSRVTFAGLALNFLAIPLMAVAQVAGMAVVPLMLLSSTLAKAAGLVACLGAEGLVRSAELVRFVPAVAFRVAPPGWWVVTTYYLALATWWRTRGLTSMVVATLAAVWMLAEPWRWIASRGDGRLHVSFLDVGQGDSAFVRLPHGTTMLVDAGGLAGTSSFDIGDRVVAPVLRNAGVRRLDYLVLTHGDPDHVGGAGAIVEEFRPRHIWEGIPVPRFEPLLTLKSAALQHRLPWTEVTAGAHLELDEIGVTVLNPPPPDWERQRVRNDDSIVIELRWRDVSFVLTGDIGKPVEHVLTPKLQPARLRVVKVPHHGSLTSSTPEFLRALHPTIAVVSAGRSNHFGHPAPEVIARYKDVGAEIYRTDRDGEVDIVTDGRSLDVHRYERGL
jgi:competence protein ComEC